MSEKIVIQGVALLGCDAMLRSQFTSKGKVIGNSEFKRLGLASAHSNDELVYSVIYNLKHGIELHIKGLGNMDHGKYINEHDLKILFQFLIDKSGSNKSLVKPQSKKAPA